MFLLSTFGEGTAEPRPSVAEVEHVHLWLAGGLWGPNPTES